MAATGTPTAQRPMFTAAPWTLGTVAVVMDGDFYEAPDEAIIYCGPEEENEIRVEGPDARANGRLIAAAPELYEALDELLDEQPPAEGGDPVGKSRWRKALIKAQTALAKARGEG